MEQKIDRLLAYVAKEKIKSTLTMTLILITFVFLIFHFLNIWKTQHVIIERLETMEQQNQEFRNLITNNIDLVVWQMIQQK